MVEETFESGMTVSLVARRHGVAPIIGPCRANYVRVSPCPDAKTVSYRISFGGYNSLHPAVRLATRTDHDAGRLRIVIHHFGKGLHAGRRQNSSKPRRNVRESLGTVEAVVVQKHPME
jgi:hypothetical protein